MGKAIPAQHPAVVLRSHYRLVRGLLAVAMVAVVGLTASVVILVNDDVRNPPAGPAIQVIAPGPTSSIRHDGGPEEGTRGAITRLPVGTRQDGGPEEGTRGAIPRLPAGTRQDGGPEEGTRGSSH
jgi:hypothetical protein